MKIKPYKNPLIAAIEKQNKLIQHSIASANLIKNIPPVFREIRESAIAVGNVDQIMKSVIPLYKIQDTFEKISKGIKQTKEDMEVFQVTIVELGYPPHYDVDISQMRMINRDFIVDKKQVVEYIDEFMAWNYDATAIYEMLIKWEGKKFLERRIQILRNVVKAHNQGMYHLAVLGIISQYEGLIVDAFSITGFVNGSIQQILLEYLLKHESMNSFGFDKVIFDYYNSNILVSFRHGEELGADISRHAILHGGHTDYGTLPVSLKVILLFDFLVDAIEELTPERILECQMAVEQKRKK
ncbi:hypothetical protein [Peribacillus simplex]|uniref:Uncharacterized protein n=1 Tax=Peribacillus simplex TaxID=1478 RepID=A0A9W4L2X7_9BACI|nr:hypothetical protein [Peribacillus simplex]WHX93516.1 hypothetical protein QNH50_12125 [Peribacillus simplex]CAH0260946.1 hypothetical protein SRABI133_03387 [Peribacillus simplex]